MMRHVRAAPSIVLLGWGIPSVGAQGVPSSLAPAPDSLPDFEVLALERVPPEAQASVVAAVMPVLSRKGATLYTSAEVTSHSAY